MTKSTFWHRCNKCRDAWNADDGPSFCRKCGSHDIYGFYAGCKECNNTLGKEWCEVSFDEQCIHDPERDDAKDYFYPKE